MNLLRLVHNEWGPSDAATHPFAALVVSLATTLQHVRPRSVLRAAVSDRPLIPDSLDALPHGMPTPPLHASCAPPSAAMPLEPEVEAERDVLWGELRYAVSLALYRLGRFWVRRGGDVGLIQQLDATALLMALLPAGTSGFAEIVACCNSLFII